MRGMLRIALSTAALVILAKGVGAADAGDGRGAAGDAIYRMRAIETRWASFENPSGGKGAAATTNRGQKGSAFRTLKAGESKTLLDVKGRGVIRRIWMTMFDKSPKMLRATRLDIWWDEARTPAVSVPLGDFFGHAAGQMRSFDSELFSSPTGTSFNCFVPMPFRTAARVVATNESAADQPCFFYDIDYSLGDRLEDDALYFHACWRRENPTALGRDFEILPRVSGKGRFLGSSVAVAAIGPAAAGVEGAVKIYLDGDGPNPTLAGTGSEDYIGGGWGMGTFAHRCQGCLTAKRELLTFYRYHLPDPIFFRSDCRVTIQQMTGGTKEEIVKLARAGAELRVVAAVKHGNETTPLAGTGAETKPEDAPDGFLIVLTRFDVSATAYFYLDRPENGLPALAGPGER